MNIRKFNTNSALTETFLPSPTGEYSIGTTELYLTDSSRYEKLMFSKKHRRIYVKIWYPAEKTGNKPYSKYLDSYPKEVILKIYKSKGINEDIVDAMKSSHTFSSPGLPVSERERKYPVLFFSPGYYFGMADLYTSFMEDIASHGYIVCSISHPYEQPYVRFPDGEEIYLFKKRAQLAYLQLLISNKLQLRRRNTQEKIEIITKNYLHRLRQFTKSLDIWVKDTEFVIDYFEKEINSDKAGELFKKMDFDKIGAYGMSFGGAAAGQVCLIDKRMKAGINMDCFQFGDIIRKPLKVPFMLMQSSYRDDWNIGNGVIYSKTEADFYKFSYLKAMHFVFTDVAVIPLLSQSARETFIGKVDGYESIILINSYVRNFFDHYLKGKPSELLGKTVDTADLRFEIRKY